MKDAESNWDLNRISPSFPYLRVLLKGRPEHREEFPKHPPMDPGHRAKIFAPFDALDGFSAQIRKKDRLFEEPAPGKDGENICLFREDP